eukprot:646023-Hanusia_phi.AAC.1
MPGMLAALGVAMAQEEEEGGREEEEAACPRVTHVVENGPAWMSGRIFKGDIVKSFAGHSVYT